MAIFPTFFLGNIAQENVFYDILERKNAFRGYKNQKLKSRKIDIFPRNLLNKIGRKMDIIPTFFFRQYRPGKCLLRYSRARKRLSRLYKEEVQKVEKLHFSKGVNPWYWSKNANYSNFFF